MPEACFQHDVAGGVFPTDVAGAALLERQPGLGPVERLDLRFLIHAQHHHPLRRIEVKPDDLGDFLLEHRVVRYIETARQVRLQASLRPFGGKSIPRIAF